MMWRIAAMWAALGCATAGCVGTRAPTEGLEGACQFRDCVCMPVARSSLTDPPQPVVWTETGDATCPPEYVLRPACHAPDGTLNEC